MVDRRLVEPDDPNLGDLYERTVGVIERAGGTRSLRVPKDLFELHINNHGKTPARLHHGAVGFCDARPLPPEPVYEDLFPLSDAIGPGDQSRIITTVKIPKGRHAHTAICGRYYWDDIWDRHWSSGFVYEIPSSEQNRDPLAAGQRGLSSISIEAPAAYWKDRPDDLPRAG
jgi:hypothetical protein